MCSVSFTYCPSLPIRAKCFLEKELCLVFLCVLHQCLEFTIERASSHISVCTLLMPRLLLYKQEILNNVVD